MAAIVQQRRPTHSTAFRVRKLRNQILFWFVISLFIIFACFPVYWMFVTTFKEVNDLYNLQNNPLLFHLPPTLEQVQYLFEKTNFATWVENTAEVGGAVVLITVLICVPAAYALARVRFPGSGSLGIGIFLTYLVPPTLLFLPLSQLVAGFGLNNSKWSLALVYPTFTIPFCTWLLMGFFKAIPRDLEEAAMLDGYSRFGAFVKVVIPISLAGILTAVIFTLTLVMQEFVYALTFITAARNYTVSVGVPTFLVHGDVYFWGSLMAGCFISSVPVAVLYNFFVDRFIAGFTAGAIK